MFCYSVAQLELTPSPSLLSLSLSAFINILSIFIFFISSSDLFHYNQHFLNFFSFVGYQVINRSPKYKNKYVHRRSSVSLDNLSPEEVCSTYSPLSFLYSSVSLLILLCLSTFSPLSLIYSSVSLPFLLCLSTYSPLSLTYSSVSLHILLCLLYTLLPLFLCSST